jgi:hypothetical protein
MLGNNKKILNMEKCLYPNNITTKHQRKNRKNFHKLLAMIGYFYIGLTFSCRELEKIEKC